MTLTSPWHWVLLVVAAFFGLGGVIVFYLALFRHRARGRRRCPRWWYDMSATAGLRCPECGREARIPRKLLKTRRRWKMAMLGVVMVLLAGAGGAGVQVLEHGWVK